MQRRDFLKTMGAAAATGIAAQQAVRAADAAAQQSPGVVYGLREQPKPLAIAMWDYSWILRHHRAGEYEDWDRVLDELQERGYNAIRMDAMPHLVAPDSDGTVVEEYFFPKDDWKPMMWGNNCSVHVRPREAIVEFLPKCLARGIHVGLASWFLTPHRPWHDAEDGLFRTWDATLTFLEQQGLLDRILYVDILNEYPLTHGFEWLKRQVQYRANAKAFQTNLPNLPVPADEAFQKKGKFTPAQQQFFNAFVTGTLTKLKAKWPQLEFLASLDAFLPWDEIDLSAFGAVDSHCWFQVHPELWKLGFDKLDAANDHGFEQLQRDLDQFWVQNQTRLVAWMDGRIAAAAQAAARHGIPCGNTEGWGTIGWYDHPALRWDFIKQSGEICVELALKHGYRFICTSNFTHPQFPGLWHDVKWHQRLTAQIRGGA